MLEDTTNCSFCQSLPINDLSLTQLSRYSPAKSMLTIRRSNSEILSCNNEAVLLFEIDRNSEILGRKLMEILQPYNDGCHPYPESTINNFGSILPISGKIYKIISSGQLVSVWCGQETEDSDAFLCFLEAVENHVSWAKFNLITDEIYDRSENFTTLFGAKASFSQLFPTICLPDESDAQERAIKSMQQTVTVSVDDFTFPLLCDLSRLDGGPRFKAQFNIFYNVTGLVTLTPRLDIHAISPALALFFCGYSVAEKAEMINKPAPTLLANFFETVGYTPSKSTDDRSKISNTSTEQVAKTPMRERSLNESSLSMVAGCQRTASPLASVLKSLSLSSLNNSSLEDGFAPLAEVSVDGRLRCSGDRVVDVRMRIRKMPLCCGESCVPFVYNVWVEKPCVDYRQVKETIGELGPYSEKYENIVTIGHGAYGFVKLCRQIESPDNRAVVKFIRKKKVPDEDFFVDSQLFGQQMVPKEIYLLAKFRHESFVKLIDVFENRHFYQMVVELHGDGMDLFEFIERRPRMDEILASYIFSQLAGAVNFMHETMRWCHCDIKDENILIDRRFVIKLIDFGSAMPVATPNTLLRGVKGTYEYAPPELTSGPRCSTGEAIDVWGMGVCLFALLFGYLPFGFGSKDKPFKVPTKISHQLELLLRRMLDPIRQLRSSVKAVLESDWVANSDDFDLIDYPFEEILVNNEFQCNNAGDSREESRADTSLLRHFNVLATASADSPLRTAGSQLFACSTPVRQQPVSAVAQQPDFGQLEL